MYESTLRRRKVIQATLKRLQVTKSMTEIISGYLSCMKKKSENTHIMVMNRVWRETGKCIIAIIFIPLNAVDEFFIIILAHLSAPDEEFHPTTHISCHII
jgi:hypothetical protein